MSYSPFQIQVVDVLVEQTSYKKLESLTAAFNFVISCLRNN
jgi:hypothetical protein